MTAAVLVGLTFAAGVLVTASGMAPSRQPLGHALGRIHEPRRPSGSRRAMNDDGGLLWARLVGEPLARTAVGGLVQRQVGADMRVTGTEPAALVTKAALSTLVGVAWAPMVAGLMALGGIQVDWVFPAIGSIALGVGGALLPLLVVKNEAAGKRRAFRHALSCHLDLVAVRLAGGAGVDSALNHSAHAGKGWAFAELRHALAEARLMGEPPWDGLARLGEELGVSELGELAASTSLAGGEGARVRSSLAAKARSIRTRGLAEAEADAQSASERMSLPIVLLMVGFVAFLGYPAVVQVLTGL